MKKCIKIEVELPLRHPHQEVKDQASSLMMAATDVVAEVGGGWVQMEITEDGGDLSGE